MQTRSHKTEKNCLPNIPWCTFNHAYTITHPHPPAHTAHTHSLTHSTLIGSLSSETSAKLGFGCHTAAVWTKQVPRWQHWLGVHAKLACEGSGQGSMATPVWLFLVTIGRFQLRLRAWIPLTTLPQPFGHIINLITLCTATITLFPSLMCFLSTKPIAPPPKGIG